MKVYPITILKCDCCFSNGLVRTCPLKNCNYKMCVTCKRKYNQNKCPACRREYNDNCCKKVCKKINKIRKCDYIIIKLPIIRFPRIKFKFNPKICHSIFIIILMSTLLTGFIGSCRVMSEFNCGFISTILYYPVCELPFLCDFGMFVLLCILGFFIGVFYIMMCMCILTILFLCCNNCKLSNNRIHSNRHRNTYIIPY